MVSPKMPIKMVRKWQKIAAMGRKRISLPKNKEEVDVGSSTTTPVALKGHFVVYTTDQKRFVVPLVYLKNNIFLELLKMSEEEFGLSSVGPIMLPCDAVVMDHIVSLFKHGVAKGSKKTFLNSIATVHCKPTATSIQGRTGQKSLVYIY